MSVVPVDDGFRLVFNRDERRDRPAAKRPALDRVGERHAAYPIDPQSGGTWIGVNDRGVVAALLNRTPGSATHAQPRSATSRGRIVPPLLGCASILEALDAVESLDPREYALFRLVLVQRMAGIIVTSDGRRLALEPLDISKPAMTASSSLGDDLVEGPRRVLFESMVARRGPDEWLASQSRFHAHKWASRPHLSVMMQRRDARTMSRTFVRVTSSRIDLRYEPTGRAAASVVRVA